MANRSGGVSVWRGGHFGFDWTGLRSTLDGRSATKALTINTGIVIIICSFLSTSLGFRVCCC